MEVEVDTIIGISKYQLESLGVFGGEVVFGGGLAGLGWWCRVRNYGYPHTKSADPNNPHHPLTDHNTA
jgi:hypothetical protein